MPAGRCSTTMVAILEKTQVQRFPSKGRFRRRPGRGPDPTTAVGNLKISQKNYKIFSHFLKFCLFADAILFTRGVSARCGNALGAVPEPSARWILGGQNDFLKTFDRQTSPKKLSNKLDSIETGANRERQLDPGR